MESNHTIKQLISDKPNRLFVVLLLIWIICDLFQAVSMEVMSDEAYYALYGQYMAWGYYDHPPMVALVNKLSAALFSGNLSIRFINVFMHAATVWLIWKILPGEKRIVHVLLFFTIAFPFFMFSFYGFITTPDGALLFFTALFLLFYKRFLLHENWINTLCLTLALVGMFYSKYHAVLVVGFIVISNFRLLKSPRFWFCALLTALLFIPHIYWQISNNFPSFRYHLIDRNDNIQLFNILKYLPEQLTVFNPIALVGILYILIRKRPKDLFERALYFLVGGTLIFFQFMTLKGRVEPHWTVIASIPMIILLYQESLRNAKFGKIILKGSLYILPLLLIARVVLAMNVLPTKFAFNGKEKKYMAIQEAAGSLPVLFAGASFQDPALYAFFTKQLSTSLSSFPTRTTQFDIWGLDKNYQDSTVFIYKQIEKDKKYKPNGFKVHGFVVKHLQTTNQIEITYTGLPETVHAGDTLQLDYTLFNPYQKDIDMNHPELPVEFCSIFSVCPDSIITNPCFYKPEFKILKAGETIQGKLNTVVPSKTSPGEYLFGLTMKTAIGIPYNSSFKKLKIVGVNE